MSVGSAPGLDPSSRPGAVYTRISLWRTSLRRSLVSVWRWLGTPAPRATGQRPQVWRLLLGPTAIDLIEDLRAGRELLAGPRRGEGIARAGRTLRHAHHVKLARLLLSRTFREPAQPRQRKHPVPLHTWTPGRHLHPQLSGRPTANVKHESKDPCQVGRPRSRSARKGQWAERTGSVRSSP
jgi:hypothetical protein